MRARTIFSFFLAISIVTMAVARERHENPYQGELPLKWDEWIDPGIQVERVVWSGLKITRGKPGRKPNELRCIGELEMSVEGRKGARVLVILMLESKDGQVLTRLEFEQFRVPGGGRLKHVKQKFKVAKQVVEKASKLYAYCEILR